jgi:hypothetical protein
VPLAALRVAQPTPTQALPASAPHLLPTLRAPLPQLEVLLLLPAFPAWALAHLLLTPLVPARARLASLVPLFQAVALPVALVALEDLLDPRALGA